MKLLIGMVTYGQVKYTRLALRYLYQLTTTPFDLAVVIGKPGDKETENLVQDKATKIFKHSKNYGLPKSLNDIYEYAFVQNDYDTCIIIGNDVLVFPNAVDELVSLYKRNGWDYISAVGVPLIEFLKKVPKARKFFKWGQRLNTDNFDVYLEYPYKSNYIARDTRKYSVIGDTHNLTLFSRSWFEKVGYVDVNFYPMYFEDNDYARRGQLLGLKMYKVSTAKYLHFVSATIREDKQRKALNQFYFEKNKDFYKQKWGGEPGAEKFKLPFNGAYFPLNGRVMLRPEISIKDRGTENLIIKHWRDMYL